MSLADRGLPRVIARVLLASAAVMLLVASGPQAGAQQSQVTAVSTRAVGGVSIDPAGMVRSATVEDVGQLRKSWLEVLAAPPDGLDGSTPTRKISLRRLDEAIRQCRQAGAPLPAEIACLGGLTQVRNVFVYPEDHDIVVIGPAEAWKVNDRGAVVGATSGRPIMLLDDLVVALRAAAGPVRSVISCSIDPTPEGIQRVRAFGRELRPGDSPQAAALAMARQLGPQTVSITGVPDTSHFARVLVAADYRMKRIGMGSEPSPVRGLPPFMELMRSSRGAAGNALPRWWLAPNYQPLLRDADGLAWELRGGSVKAMAESDFFSAAGERQESRRADPASQKWADLFTERYDELSLADPVFGELRNCMDLAVVAALVVGENLTQKARAELPMLLGTDGLQVAELPVPKHVESKSVIARTNRTMIACGGVQINAWQLVADAQPSDTLASARKEAAIPSQSDRWWD